MELDQMKLAWQAMDRRLEQQNALSRQLFRDTRLDRARRGLVPLIFGQNLQIFIGAWLMLLAAPFWIAHRDSLHLLLCGVLMHVYGLMLVLFAVRNLHLIKRIDYAAPVLSIQRQLAALRSWRQHVEARVFAISGCFIWIPGTLVLFKLGGADVWVDAPLVVWSFIGSGFVCLAVLYGIVRWSRRPGRGRLKAALDNSNVGQSLRKAQGMLEEVARFERE